MTADLGTDLSCVTDLDGAGAVVSGRLLLGQAYARRLSTPNGGLIDDPIYGYDLTQFVNADLGAGDIDDIQSKAAAEGSKDERVLSCSVVVTVSIDGIMSVVASMVDSDGPFDLVLSVSDVTVDLLKVE